jgi:hypothetical protein
VSENSTTVFWTTTATSGKNELDVTIFKNICS